MVINSYCMFISVFSVFLLFLSTLRDLPVSHTEHTSYFFVHQLLRRKQRGQHAGLKQHVLPQRDESSTKTHSFRLNGSFCVHSSRETSRTRGWCSLHADLLALFTPGHEKHMLSWLWVSCVSPEHHFLLNEYTDLGDKESHVSDSILMFQRFSF